MKHTDFRLQSKEVDGVNAEYRKCSSCGAICIEGKEPYFNLICQKATANEQERLNYIKSKL